MYGNKFMLENINWNYLCSMTYLKKGKFKLAILNGILKRNKQKLFTLNLLRCLGNLKMNTMVDVL